MAVAFVFKIVELANDFFAGFSGVKFQMLEHGTFVFFVAKTESGFAPSVKDIVLNPHGFGIKIARSFGKRWSLHLEVVHTHANVEFFYI